MNLKLLNTYAAEIRREIIESGFKRDLDDYIESLPSNADNIISIRKMAEDIKGYLDRIYSGDVPRYLTALIPKELGSPFTTVNYLVMLNQLLSDTSIKQDEFYDGLLNVLHELSTGVESDVDSIAKFEDFIKPYAKGTSAWENEDWAVLSLIFHDFNTIHNLGQLTKSFADWNRLLPIYHQLIKSDSPEGIKIVGVESGSIDLIINLDVDVSLNLVEAIKVGMMAFGSYLLYKKGVDPLVKTYVNQRLIELEKEKDGLLLKNIGEAVRAQITLQHENARKTNPAVSDEASDKKIEQVAKLITSHVVKGNDVKLLSVPKSDAQVQERASKDSEELRDVSLETRMQLAKISGTARQDLLEMYDSRDDLNADVCEIEETAKETKITKKNAK